MGKITEDDIRKIIGEVLRSHYERKEQKTDLSEANLYKKVLVIPGTRICNNLPAKRTECVAEADLVLLDGLSTDMLVSLAYGHSDREEYRVIEALKSGKKIFVLDDGIDYLTQKDVMPPGLKCFYNKCLERIRVFGVQVITRQNLSDIINNPDAECGTEVCESPTVISFSKSYLSEKEIRELNRNHDIEEIRYGSQTNISPLAKDYAREESIRLVRNR